MSERLAYNVTPWAKKRFKAQIRVDGYDTEKAFFDTKHEAEQWSKAKIEELREEVRE